MRFPGVLSRLHSINNPDNLAVQLQQCVAMRAEAVLINEHPSVETISLLQTCAPTLPLYQLGDQQADKLSLHTLSHSDIASEPGMGLWAPETALPNLESWLKAGHQHLIVPAAVFPVVRSLLNIWPLDPHLTSHYLREFSPLISEASESELTAVFMARENQDSPRSDWVQRYMKLERKLFRAHLDH